MVERNFENCLNEMPQIANNLTVCSIVMVERNFENCLSETPQIQTCIIRKPRSMTMSWIDIIVSVVPVRVVVTIADITMRINEMFFTIVFERIKSLPIPNFTREVIP